MAAQVSLSTLVANPEDRFSCDEARREKNYLRGLQLGKTQTGLLSYRGELEA